MNESSLRSDGWSAPGLICGGLVTMKSAMTSRQKGSISRPPSIVWSSKKKNPPGPGFLVHGYARNFSFDKCQESIARSGVTFGIAVLICVDCLSHLPCESTRIHQGSAGQRCRAGAQRTTVIVLAPSLAPLSIDGFEPHLYGDR